MECEFASGGALGGRVVRAGRSASCMVTYGRKSPAKLSGCTSCTITCTSCEHCAGREQRNTRGCTRCANTVLVISPSKCHRKEQLRREESQKQTHTEHGTTTPSSASRREVRTSLVSTSSQSICNCGTIGFSAGNRGSSWQLGRG